MYGASMRAMPELLEAFRTGGGVGWSRFGEDMLTGQGDTNRPLFMTLLGREWLPAIPGVHEALTGGGRVADIGYGTGWSSIAMALAYPAATVDGFDIDEDSAADARRNAADDGVSDRVTFHAADAAGAGSGDGYDLALAFECIHDMADPVSVLAAMRRLVRRPRRGGRRGRGRRGALHRARRGRRPAHVRLQPHGVPTRRDVHRRGRSGPAR